MSRFHIFRRPDLTSAAMLVAALVTLNCSSTAVRDDARFSYENLYQDRYTRGNGGIIPITLERGESYSGTISKDQKYLYFSSNTSGNYDIYLRDLGDVFSVPVVTTVTNQREPAISPDGNYLVYVDDELDPDGDIILLKVNPKKLVELYRDRQQPGDEWFASRAKNLTNSEKNRVRARDANPTWSPDGKWVAYSSDLIPQKADDLGPGAGALQNIWLMPVDNPEEKRQLTTKGGVMPHFSEDGSKIVYISYEGINSLGAVYEIEIASGKTRKLTNGRTLDFYPTYAPGGGIVLTRIAADTNGDGQIDRKDAGQIIRIFPEGEQGVVDDDDYIPLTSPSDHVFDSRVSNFIGGSVVLAQLKGEDINVAFIPLSGAIPIKPDIRQQQTYLQTLAKKKNQARYCMGLQQLPSAFSSAADLVVYDAVSALRRGRCDAQVGRELQDYLTAVEPGELALYRLLNDLGAVNPDYADLRGVVTLESLADTGNASAYFSAIESDDEFWQKIGNTYDDADELAIRSFVRHEHARLFIRQGKRADMLKVAGKLIATNPAYLALDELLLEAGIADSSSLPATELVYLISDKPDQTLIKGYFPKGKAHAIAVRPHIRRGAEKFLLEFFDRQYEATNEEAQEQFIAGFPEANNKTLHAIFALSTARDYENTELYEESVAATERVKTLTSPGTLLHFYAATLAAENTEVLTGAEAAMQKYAAAIAEFRDSEPPENVKDIVAKAGQYYSDRANAARAAGDDRAAAKEYQTLLELYLSAHANRLKGELAAGDLLDYALSLDQIALRAAGNDTDLLDTIVKFYDDRIDLARRFLVSEFIFGRGFLRSQLGIRRHLISEADGLSRSEKKQVFEDFRKAETDFNWCFFANARFADAYIMLGWMYQFIDEKREVVLEPSTGKKDREIFESLYRTYFPDYLFEKNIRLYQKTLALFGQSGSPRVRNSFHLNIANNYFLLSNYSQAEEHYASILDAKGNPDFRFETPEQQMMFYYHFARSLYFSGKNELAARYLQFVEANLDARYPITGVSAEMQKTNQARREIAYKTFALNAEYSQNMAAAIEYNRRILAERAAVAAETPVAMVHLELARLRLRQGDYNASLDHTLQAEQALGKEPKVDIPKFKLRIRWFWVYEPWSWLVGVFYKLSYDDVFIGDNHLAFELPTVNRYQLLYSIRADIYRNKGLLHEASSALGHLVEYAEKDKTKHGAETLSAAVSRRAELEFSLKNWDAARELYEVGLKAAEKAKDGSKALALRKNIALCKVRKLETEFKPVQEKISAATKEADSIRDFVAAAVDARIEAEIETRKATKGAKNSDLTQEERQKFAYEVRTNLQPLLFYEGVNRAHAAEMSDFRSRFGAGEESFDQYMQRKQGDFDLFRGALRYFRGYAREPFSQIENGFEPDLKNNGLRLKLAMNRAKVLQEMDLLDEAIAELKEVQEKSQEFRAQLEYTVATYRMHRVYEDAERESQLSTGPYENLVNYFTANPGFLRENTELFERVCNIVSERAIRNGEILKAIRTEDLKRQQVALQMYFDDLVLFGDKQAQFGQLLIAEQKRRALSARIRAGRLARQQVQPLEKELIETEKQITSLRQTLRMPDRLDYRYETFFAQGFSDAELARFASNGIIYVLKPLDQTYFVYIGTSAGKRAPAWRLEVHPLSTDAAISPELATFVQKMRAHTLILSPQILQMVTSDPQWKKMGAQTSLRAAINFSNNPDLAKRNLLQLSREGSLLSFNAGNELDYAAPQPLTRARVQADITALPMHRNVIDYEAELARKGTIVDISALTPASLFSLRSNPNFIIASRQSRENLNATDDFRFAASVDLFFSAMGAGQVFHTFAPRKQAKTAIEKYLNEGIPSAGGLITGNATVSTGRATELPATVAGIQRSIYIRKIAAARNARAFNEASSYAEDAVSLFPGDPYFQFHAGELHLINGERTLAQVHMDSIAQALKDNGERRDEYARLLIRAGELKKLEVLIAEYPQLAETMRRNRQEYDSLLQLRALTDGRLSLLQAPFLWDKPGSSGHEDLITAISPKLKNNLLHAELCDAGLLAFSFRLTVQSCLKDLGNDRSVAEDRVRIARWVAGLPVPPRVAMTEDAIIADHAAVLIDSGFYADALAFGERALVPGKSARVNLLAMSFLKVLALRKADPQVSAGIARLLTRYGNAAIGTTANEQARTFYALLVSTESVWQQGTAAITQAPIHAEAGGVLAVRNMLLRLALTVRVAGELPTQPATSGLYAQNSLEQELRDYNRYLAGDNSALNCRAMTCMLVIRRHLSTGSNEAALDLILRSQIDSPSSIAREILPAGTYGLLELNTGEFYRWTYDGQRAQFEPVQLVAEAQLSAPAGYRYLFYPVRHNNLNARKIFPDRQSILLRGGDTASGEAAGKLTDVSFATTDRDPLYGSLFAYWGRAASAGQATVVIKPPFEQTPAGLHIYSSAISLAQMPRLKPGGYHLFCESSEACGGFSAFAQGVVENMVERKMRIEDAYLAAFGRLKGRQASTRPLYYLYRN